MSFIVLWVLKWGEKLVCSRGGVMHQGAFTFVYNTRQPVYVGICVSVRV